MADVTPPGSRRAKPQKQVVIGRGRRDASVARGHIQHAVRPGHDVAQAAELPLEQPLSRVDATWIARIEMNTLDMLTSCARDEHVIRKGGERGRRIERGARGSHCRVQYGSH